jgi:hypothetical protein
MLLTQSVGFRLSLKDLFDQMIFLKLILTNLGYKFYWPVSFDQKFQVKKFLLKFLKVHSTNLFYFTRFNALRSSFETIVVDGDDDDDDIELIYVNLKINEQESLFAKASIYLSLCLYRNQIINYFVSLGLTSVCLVALSDEGNNRFMRKDSIFKYYSFLTSIFPREFLFHPAEIEKLFDLTLVYFKIMKLSDEEEGKIRVSKHNYKQIKLFILLIKPFIFNYSIVYKLILSKKMNRFDNEKNFYKKLQECLFDEITRGENGKIFDFEYTYELLSLNLLSNSVLVLRNFKILNKNSNEFEIDLEKLNGLYLQLCDIIVNLELNRTKFENEGTTSKIIAKL